MLSPIFLCSKFNKQGYHNANRKRQLIQLFFLFLYKPQYKIHTNWKKKSKHRREKWRSWIHQTIIQYIMLTEFNCVYELWYILKENITNNIGIAYRWKRNQFFSPYWIMDKWATIQIEHAIEIVNVMCAQYTRCIWTLDRFWQDGKLRKEKKN